MAGSEFIPLDPQPEETRAIEYKGTIYRNPNELAFAIFSDRNLGPLPDPEWHGTWGDFPWEIVMRDEPIETPGLRIHTFGWQRKR